jgi:hypothetical protein
MGNAGDGRNGFDFLHGRWEVRNRRLVKRLQGCTEWQEFEAISEVVPILGGLGNVEQFHGQFPDNSTSEGLTLRIFNPESQLWSIWWADNHICSLTPPVVGGFRDGHGEFTGKDECSGVPVDVVFHWTVNGSNSAHWQQAFSADGGATWEMNWEMFFTRLD